MATEAVITVEREVQVPTYRGVLHFYAFFAFLAIGGVTLATGATVWTLDVLWPTAVFAASVVDDPAAEGCSAGWRLSPGNSPAQIHDQRHLAREARGLCASFGGCRGPLFLADRPRLPPPRWSVSRVSCIWTGWPT